MNFVQSFDLFIMLLFKKKESLPKHFVTVFVTAAAVVFFWRGVWGFLDYYLFPENPLLSYLSSIFIGLAILWWDDKRISELQH